MKKTITVKIIFSYLAIVLASLILAGVLFNFAVRIYLEKEALKTLRKDAAEIINLIGKDLMNEGETADAKIKQFRELMKKGPGSFESLYGFISKEYRVVLPKNPEQVANIRNYIVPELRKGLPVRKRDILRFTSGDMKYLGIVYPTERGWLVLYTPVVEVQKLGRDMFMVLMITLLISGVLAVSFGVLIARSIARPIIKLKNRAEMLSKRDFDTRVEIHTGDELEELANTVNKMAAELKEYDIAQKRFLQNASHELKTPLMSIQGYAEGVKDGVFDDNQHALEVIVEESTRLKRIVEELVFLSKLETMEDFYRFSSESINEMIEKSVEKVKSLAVKNHIHINLMLFKDMNIKLDRDKFIQALINILGNCLRYASSEINIITSNDGKSMEIRINDDGEGFDEKDIKNVFERFYKGKKGNTGLGMAITKVIVERHGGTIQAANGRNGGAEFTIRLPLN